MKPSLETWELDIVVRLRDLTSKLGVLDPTLAEIVVEAIMTRQELSTKLKGQLVEPRPTDADVETITNGVKADLVAVMSGRLAPDDFPYAVRALMARARIEHDRKASLS